MVTDALLGNPEAGGDGGEGEILGCGRRAEPENAGEDMGGELRATRIGDDGDEFAHSDLEPVMVAGGGNAKIVTISDRLADRIGSELPDEFVDLGCHGVAGIILGDNLRATCAGVPTRGDLVKSWHGRDRLGLPKWGEKSSASAAMEWPATIQIQDLIEVIGITTQRVQQLAKLKRIPSGDGKGNYPMRDTLVAFIRHLQTKKGAGDAAGLDILKEQKMAKEIELLQAKLDQLALKVVPTDEVAQFLGQVAAGQRVLLQHKLETELGPLVADGEVAAKIAAETPRILDEVCDLMATGIQKWINEHQPKRLSPVERRMAEARPEADLLLGEGEPDAP